MINRNVVGDQKKIKIQHFPKLPSLVHHLKVDELKNVKRYDQSEGFV